MVGVMTSSFHDWLSTFVGNPHNPSFMPGIFTPFGTRMTFWERLLNTYISAAVTSQINYYMSQQVSYVKKYFNMDTSIEDLYQDLAAILVNSHHSINGVKPFTQGIIEVGGLHVKNDADPLTPEVQKWLDESTHGCIFFTFGSMMRIESFPKPVLQTFYKVFEKLAPVRVLMKVAKKEELLPGLPKNVMIQPWFSQVSVFKHKNVKAFITHGGLMGTMEAIYYAIPMVGIPLFGDQKTNIANGVSKNIAVTLNSIENVTEETLSAAINAVLYDKTYRTSINKISQLFKDRPMTAIDTAVYWVEYVARNGYVLQSPAIHLTWYQQYLLDVYAFVLVCLTIVLYIAIRLIKAVKNYFTRSSSNKVKRPSESKKRK
ncbi:UDP-glucuronosyltransferase 1-6-like [Ceratina calcarata]|uniref:UDP-glucuronosyltransferase 1-6-like n=1 Tax=Ceratina calcarata TaxID=156304 RepID=A0AAJ7J7Z8_9HYME|nr:UDP-glucuronosyltransferase 1-6-like [Ceratina calcarata]